MTACELWALSSDLFRVITTRIMNENLSKRTDLLRSIIAFKKLTNEQLNRCATVMQEERFPPGMEICKPFCLLACLLVY